MLDPAAIFGPIIYGLIIPFSSGNSKLLMLVSPIFLALEQISINDVRSGEPYTE